MTHLLGKQVEVVLDNQNSNSPVVVKGKLLSYGEGGDFVVQTDDGFLHYCWPMLECREYDG